MAKRGETRPWRIRFQWQGSDIKGTETRSSEAEAREFAAQLCRNADRRDVPIHVTVQHRDQPEPLLVIDHQPAPVCGHCDGPHAHNDCPAVARTLQAETAADEARAADLAATHGISTASARRIVAETPARVALVFAQAPKDEPW